MRKSELKEGAIYFGVAYEDDDFLRPILHTYEYLGETSGVAEAPLLFRFVGSEDQLQLAEQQLDVVLTAQDLIERLKRFRDGLPMHSPYAS